MSTEPPAIAFEVISVAENLARAYVARGGDLVALFTAYAGLVVARDQVVGRDCLMAVHRLLILPARPFPGVKPPLIVEDDPYWNLLQTSEAFRQGKR